MRTRSSRRPASLTLATLAMLAGSACWAARTDAPTDQGDVKLTLQLTLRDETQDIGATPASLYVFTGTGALSRAQAIKGGQVCTLNHTPTVSCDVMVPKGSTVTVMATEGEPGVAGAFGPAQSSDSARTNQYIEFAAWTATCPFAMQPEYGSCAYTATSDTTIAAEWKYMLQVVIYQIGAGRFDFLADAPTTLTVPEVSSNILELVGCRAYETTAAPCDSGRTAGGSPFHRVTIELPRYSSMLLLPFDGDHTHFLEWDDACTVNPGLCVVDPVTMREAQITPFYGDSTQKQFVITLRYEYWDCAGVASDRDTGGCTLVRP